MDTSIINPFIDSVNKVLITMCNVTPIVGEPYETNEIKATGDITGFIGLAGNHVTGYMLISFEQDSILELVSNMFMENFTEISSEVIDAVGELTNIIAGGTKSALSEMDYVIEMASPMMFKGSNFQISELSDAPKITVPFKTKNGGFIIQASLSRRITK